MALSCYYAWNFSTGQKKEETFNRTRYIEKYGIKTRQYFSHFFEKARCLEETDSQSLSSLSISFLLISIFYSQ